MSDPQDQTLIQQTLGGQTEAFGSIIQKYKDRLFNGMVQIVRNESEAEDVVQEAFLLAFKKLSTFRGNSAFFTWLYRIAYNVAVTRIRRRKPTVSLYANSETRGAIEFADETAAPEERMIREERVAQLARAMEKLSEEHRAIIVLREMEDLDYDAISEILDLPIGTVRSRLHRARNHLRELLEAIMNRN
ncbi:MAG: sigma-70 family RNA polymerase sigma factor [Planctomycetota bacterium]